MKLLNILTISTILLNSAVYAANIKDVSMLKVDGDFFLNFKTDEKCSVEKEDLLNETLVKLYCAYGQRKTVSNPTSFISRIDIIPKNKTTLVEIYHDKGATVAVNSYNTVVSIKVSNEKFMEPDIKVSNDGLQIAIPNNVPVDVKKEDKQIKFIVDGFKIRSFKKKLNSLYADSVSAYSVGDRSIIVISLKRDVPAQILKVGKYYQVKFLDPLAVNKDKKIKLDFPNGDVRTIVRAIADIVGLNVVFDPEIKGTVTVKFITPVDWKEALKAVLEPLGFTYVKEGPYLRITTKKKLKEEIEAQPVNTYIVPLNYAYASEVAKVIENYLGIGKGKKGKSRETVEVDERTNSLILKVTPKHYKEILEIVKNTDRQTKQVSIEAKIVLVNSNFDKELGLNWSFGLWNTDGDKVYKAGSFQANDGVIIPGVTSDPGATATTLPVQPYTLAVGILKKDQSLRAELALKASELNGDGRLVSQPKVVTLDNKEATIEQGMEIPYKVIDENGNISTEFKKASLILKVKPHVTNDNKIVLDLEIRKDKPNYDYVALTGSQEPAIDTRNVKTQIMVDNGDTLVIGGIYEQEKSKSVTGVPGLSKIPLLGWLFKSEVIKNSNSELLIFITPKVITTSSSTNK